MSFRVSSGRSLVLLAAALLAVAPLAAQVSTGTIEVLTVESDGTPVPGVSVRAENAATGLERLGVTDVQGLALLQALPPGTYVVGATLSGFAPVRQEGVALRVGQTLRIRVEMQMTMAEEITVTAEAPMVDLYSPDVATNIVPEQIEQLPTPDRDFQRLAFIAPGVQRERGGYRFITNAPLIGGSGNASQATIMVDGVDFTDQSLGLARTRFSQDAIQEFQVVNNRYDAEMANSAGGALSIITKGGANQVRGSAFGFYRADSLRETGEFETGEADFTRYQAGFTLGGPIVRDRTHYFTSLEYIDEENISVFSPRGAFAGTGGDIEHPFEQLLFMGSLDHQISDAQTLQLRGVMEYYREDNFRVGGVADESSGMELNRDNYNMMGGHTWMVSEDKLNELRFQAGRKKFDEPNNSDAMSEYFTFGTTLVTGANIVGDQEMTGDYIELRDTYHLHLAAGEDTHDLKLGGSVQWIEEDWYYPVFPTGWMLWASDDRTLPYAYYYAPGPPGLTVDTTLFGAFVQDDWRLSPNVTVALGLRYDYDTDGNNPDFTHPYVPEERSVDDDNFQPRAGFSWDLTGQGSTVLRGGAGLFTGRYLLVPAFVEQQQNGLPGSRTPLTRVNGLFFGLPPAFYLDPANPETTGLLLAPNIGLLQSNLEAPESMQASLGLSQRLGETGLYLDLEAMYSEGDNEIIIRDVNFDPATVPARPDPTWAQVNMYTNEGRSEYTALIASLNGSMRGGHLIAANVTWGDKQNIQDDFSPALINYPSDPSDIEGEWGRSRSDEEWRVVLSGVFRLPWQMTIAPVYLYGSGQPWNRRLGYDYNLDTRVSDRFPDVPRNSMEGPDYKQFNLRLTKTFALGDGGDLDLILEGFNIFDTVNYDVNSVDSSEFLAGPTLLNPGAAYVPNPNYGNYSATLDPREIQLGLRYRF